MLRPSLMAAACLAMASGAAACSMCNPAPPQVWATPFHHDLFVGDKAKVIGGAESIGEFCGGVYENSTDDPGAYQFKSGDTTIAHVTQFGDITARSAGTTVIIVNRNDSGHNGTSIVRIARPILGVEFVMSPSSPKIGDTVDVVTNAIDVDGAVTPGAHFTGAIVQATLPPGGKTPTQVIPYAAPERIRFVVNSSGHYMVSNGATHRGAVVATGKREFDVP